MKPDPLSLPPQNESLSGDYDQTRDNQQPLSQQAIIAHLQTERIGRNLRVFNTIDSTNTYLLEIPTETVSPGLVVVSEYQHAGKGRQGRSWIMPAGSGLLMSILLEYIPTQTPLIPLAGAVSVIDTLREMNIAVYLKWPNDIVALNPQVESQQDLYEHKLGGLLCETRNRPKLERTVLGIGLNVNLWKTDLPVELQAQTTSVLELHRKPIDRNQLIAQILNRFEEILLQIARDQGSTLIARARNCCSSLGHHLKIKYGSRTFEGIAEDIDPHGHLVLRQDSGYCVVLKSGEIIQARRMD